MFPFSLFLWKIPTKFNSFVLLFWDRGIMYHELPVNSLCSQGWPWTSGPSASVSQVLGLQVCTTTPSFFFGGGHYFFNLVSLALCPHALQDMKSEIIWVTNDSAKVRGVCDAACWISLLAAQVLGDLWFHLPFPCVRTRGSVLLLGMGFLSHSSPLYRVPSTLWGNAREVKSGCAWDKIVLHFKTP